MNFSCILRRLNLKYSFFYQQEQYMCTFRFAFPKLESSDSLNWDKLVNKAEEMVEHPTCFLALRWLLSDDVAKIAIHLPKLVDTRHPILHTAKKLLYADRYYSPSWNLIVLLLSKAAGHHHDTSEEDLRAGVLHNQRSLAEITEMLHTSHILHKSIANLNHPTTGDDIHFGNKIAILAGDILLCNIFQGLANMRNQEVFEIIASYLRNLTEAAFLGPRDGQINSLPSKPNTNLKRIPIHKFGDISLKSITSIEALGNARAEWTLRNVLNTADLLGKACQSTLKLANHSESLQTHGYKFGKHFALALQASRECQVFENPYTQPFDLISGPVLFQLEHDSELYREIEKGLGNIEDVDYKLIYEAVLSGPGIEKTKELHNENSELALNNLIQFPESETRSVLANIILASKEL